MTIISHVRKVNLCCTRLESQKVSRESYSLSAIRVYGIDAINLFFYLCEHGFYQYVSRKFQCKYSNIVQLYGNTIVKICICRPGKSLTLSTWAMHCPSRTLLYTDYVLVSMVFAVSMSLVHAEVRREFVWQISKHCSKLQAVCDDVK